jgi:hypothetical protein
MGNATNNAAAAAARTAPLQLSLVIIGIPLGFMKMGAASSVFTLSLDPAKCHSVPGIQK